MEKPRARRDLLLLVYAERNGVCRCCQFPIVKKKPSEYGRWARTNHPAQVWCDHCKFLSCRQYWNKLGYANALCRGNERPIESQAEIKGGP